MPTRPLLAVFSGLKSHTSVTAPIGVNNQPRCSARGKGKPRRRGQVCCRGEYALHTPPENIVFPSCLLMQGWAPSPGTPHHVPCESPEGFSCPFAPARAPSFPIAPGTQPLNENPLTPKLELAGENSGLMGTGSQPQHSLLHWHLGQPLVHRFGEQMAFPSWAVAHTASPCWRSL